MTRVRMLAGLLATTLSIMPTPMLAQSVQEQLRQLAAQNAELARRIAELEAQIATTTATANETAARVSEAPPAQRLVTSNTGRNRLEIYGQVNRAVVAADNGNERDVFFVDNSHASSRFGLRAEHRTEGRTVIGGQFELEPRLNPSGDSRGPNFDGKGQGPGNGFRERIVQVYVDDVDYGRLFLGQGSLANDGIGNINLWGAGVILSSNPADMGGSLSLARSGDQSGQSTGPRVLNVFSDLNVARDSRIRYDTPEFAGARLSASVANGGETDLGLRWNADFDGVRVAVGAGVGFDRDDADRQYAVSASALYKGFSVAAGYVARDDANADRDGRSRDPEMFYAALGYQANLFEIGSTAFGIDYQMTKDLQFRGDEATTFGVGAVQNLPRFGTDLYLGARFYLLDRDAAADGGTRNNSFDDMFVVMSGARVRF